MLENRNISVNMGTEALVAGYGNSRTHQPPVHGPFDLVGCCCPIVAGCKGAHIIVQGPKNVGPTGNHGIFFNGVVPGEIPIIKKNI
jgi:hypothetical protein